MDWNKQWQPLFSLSDMHVWFQLQLAHEYSVTAGCLHHCDPLVLPETRQGCEQCRGERYKTNLIWLWWWLCSVKPEICSEFKNPFHLVQICGSGTRPLLWYPNPPVTSLPFVTAAMLYLKLVSWNRGKASDALAIQVTLNFGLFIDHLGIFLFLEISVVSCWA